MVYREKEKFEQLFKQYYERLVLFAESYVADLATAEDIVQDTFLTLLSRPQFKNVKYDRSYLYGCVKNSCIDHLRKLKIQDQYNTQILNAIFYSGNIDFTEEESIILKLEELIGQLPEQRRHILNLSIYQQMSYSDIAATTNLSVNTVKTHIRMAYRDLRKQISECNNDLLSILLVILYRNSSLSNIKHIFFKKQQQIIHPKM